MATPSVKISISFSATQVIVDDTTGNYSVSNTGGYGAPNDAFADFAHYLILRKKNVNQVADVVMVLDSYNPLSATQFTATRSIDGWYEAKKLNIRKWTAGSYVLNDVRYYNGSVYKATTATSGTPEVSPDWLLVTDLTTIESNPTVVVATDGRVTVYNADLYWSRQIAINSQKGHCGDFCLDDKQKSRIEKIEFHIQVALIADQTGDNESGEWNTLTLITMGAK
jgi:hypothetical protein